MRVATSQMFSGALLGIQERGTQIEKLQKQIGRGERILAPSDDPVAATRILELSEVLATREQFQANADMADSRLTQEETVLASAGDILQRVRELTIQGNNGHLSPQDRSSLATEVREQLGALTDLANTQDSNGEYLFAGFQRHTQPFTIDTTGDVTYNGDLGQRLLQIGPSQQIADGDSGQAVFMAIRNGNGTFAAAAGTANTGNGVITTGSVTDATAYQAHDFRIVFTGANTYDVIDDTTASTILSGQSYVDGAAISFNGIATSIRGAPAAGDVFTVTPSANQSVFETMSNVIAALESSTATEAAKAQFQTNMGRAIGDIDQALEKVLGMRASAGTRLKTIETQKSANEDISLDLKTARSQLQDLDYLEAISRLNAEMTALQAAQKAFVEVGNLSLFNFL